MVILIVGVTYEHVYQVTLRIDNILEIYCSHELYDKLTLFKLDVKCYCEQHGKAYPFNRIICASQGSVQQSYHRCEENKQCTGATDFRHGVDPANVMNLCTPGNG